VEKRGRAGEKARSDTLQGVDARVKSTKVTVVSKTGRQFSGENKQGYDTAELAETVMTKNKVVARFLRKKIEGDTLSCRPGCHPP